MQALKSYGKYIQISECGEKDHSLCKHSHFHLCSIIIALCHYKIIMPFYKRISHMLGIPSLSSCLMSALITWRNPDGAEENWTHQSLLKVDNSNSFLRRKIITEICFVLVGTVAVVEMVAHSFFALTAVIFFPSEPSVSTFFRHFTSSCAFTCLWTAVNALFLNFTNTNLPTEESSTRFEFTRLNPILNFLREGELQYLSENKSPLFETCIEEGRKIIREEIIAPAPNETRELIEEMDPSACIFIPSKIVYLYTLGQHKNDPLPLFLKTETQMKISQLRSQLYVTEEQKSALSRIFSEIKLFTIEPEDAEIHTILRAIREAGTEELQGSVCIGECYKRALQYTRAASCC